MGKMRVYVDASVFGGQFDDEFAESTKPFFDAILAGQATALISDTLVGELAGAPERVQDLLDRVRKGPCEHLGLRDEAQDLRDAYLAAGVLTPRWTDDALHVAHAVVARADAIASWNFKHMVNPLRIRAFDGVNTAQGYGPVVIMTPSDIANALEEKEHEPEE
jgi:predicted nucleic acid-binding protein